MDSHLKEMGLKGVELCWYGSLAGVLLSVSTFRYRKAPYFMVFGMGVGSGMALVQANASLRKALGEKPHKSDLTYLSG